MVGILLTLAWQMLCWRHRNVHGGMWGHTATQQEDDGARVETQRALGFQREQDGGSLVVFVCELVLSGGLLRNGLQAASAFRLGAAGAAR